MSTGSPSPLRVLVVDDHEPARELLSELLSGAGHEVETAGDGEEGWAVLQEGGARFDVVLLDWMMPRMDGLTLLKKIKGDDDLQMIPVIMQTARAAREDVLAGIAAGAYYYVVKPVDAELVLSMVATAGEDHSRHRKMQESLRRGIGAIEMMREGSFRFRTVAEASSLATLLSRAFPDPESTVVGLGELLLNAVEHGNLEISYDEKTELLEQGRWDEEVDRRLALPGFAQRTVDVRFERDADELRITISDQGAGFEWERYLTVTPDRVFDRHGRGIAMACHVSFDRLEYQPPGNRVLAVVDLPVAAAPDREGESPA